jgi:hypothetical protein
MGSFVLVAFSSMPLVRQFLIFFDRIDGSQGFDV